jgi:hypothetical protein
VYRDFTFTFDKENELDLGEERNDHQSKNIQNNNNNTKKTISQKLQSLPPSALITSLVYPSSKMYSTSIPSSSSTSSSSSSSFPSSFLSNISHTMAYGELHPSSGLLADSFQSYLPSSRLYVDGATDDDNDGEDDDNYNKLNKMAENKDDDENNSDNVVYFEDDETEDESFDNF